MATISGFDRLFLDASFLIAVYGVEDAMHGRARNRRAVSFVDVLCAVVIRRELSGSPALSFDRDFRTMGLTVIG
jgi:hypothetical protein